jgi:hypothetical protein
VDPSSIYIAKKEPQMSIYLAYEWLANKNVPSRTMGTRLGNNVSYFEPGPHQHNWDILSGPVVHYFQYFSRNEYNESFELLLLSEDLFL